MNVKQNWTPLALIKRNYKENEKEGETKYDNQRKDEFDGFY